MSWLSPGRWLLCGALIAALLLGIWRLDVSRQQIGYAKAQAEYAAQVKVADAKREAIAPPVAAKQEAAQVHIRTVTKTIIEKVPVYVKADDCPMPAGFRVLHDAAAHGEVPVAARIADAAAVPAQDVAGTVAENYGLCLETSERLRGLQEWVSLQESLK